MVQVGVERDGTADHVVELKAVVAELQIADEGLGRRRLTAEAPAVKAAVPATQQILHACGHPAAGRGGMAVVAAVAEVLAAAVVLIQDLGVVQIAVQQGGVGLVQQITAHGRGGADIVALPLGGADLGDGHKAVVAGAHACLQPAGGVVLGPLVVGQIALQGVAEARAVHAQKIPRTVQGVLEAVEAVAIPVGGPHVGGRPGGGALPVHEEHHEAAFGAAADLLQDGESVGVGVEGVGGHVIGVVDAAHGVGHHQGGILVPGGEGLVVPDLGGAGRQMGLQPAPIPLGGRLPASLGGRPDHGEIGGIALAVVSPRVEADLQGNAAVLLQVVNGLDAPFFVVSAHVQAAVLPQVGHHLGADHVGEDGVTAQGGIAGIPMAEIRPLPHDHVGDQRALVVGVKHTAARALGVVFHQLGQGDEGKVHPFDQGVLVRLLRGHAPGGGISLGGQGNRHPQRVRPVKAPIHSAVGGGGEVDGIVGGEHPLRSRVIPQTQAEQGGGGQSALLAAKGQGGHLAAGELGADQKIR